MRRSQPLYQWPLFFPGRERPTLRWMDGSGTQEHCQIFSCPSLSFALYTGSSLTAPLKDDQSREEARRHSALSTQNALPCKTSSIICAPKRPRPCRELVCKITPRSPGHCEGGHGALSFSRERSGGRGCCDAGHCLCSPASGSVRLVSPQMFTTLVVYSS